jgi:hypothetical protein
MRRASLVLVLASCAKPLPPKSPPAQLAADAVADLAGRWVANDDLDWGYAMTIAPSGQIDVRIDRGKMGRCEQTGTMVAQGHRTFRVTYSRGECNPQVVGVPLELTVTSFTGDYLTVVVAEQSRTYQRAADEPRGRLPAIQLQ